MDGQYKERKMFNYLLTDFKNPLINKFTWNTSSKFSNSLPIYAPHGNC